MRVLLVGHDLRPAGRYEDVVVVAQTPAERQVGSGRETPYHLFPGVDQKDAVVAAVGDQDVPGEGRARRWKRGGLTQQPDLGLRSDAVAAAGEHDRPAGGRDRGEVGEWLGKRSGVAHAPAERVDLEDLTVAERHAGPFQDLLGDVDRTGQHDRRL